MIRRPDIEIRWWEWARVYLASFILGHRLWEQAFSWSRYLGRLEEKNYREEEEFRKS